ncbi:MAG TPA: dephospho-CoA kinase [Dehalococcoidia bacterium]|nr:dephospho-CoA kinase [Dehalococcoidia bacterium]
MVVIGLTGGILSGKSTISRMLAEKGAVIMDADKIGHEAYKPRTKTWQELRDAFGDGILKKNGEIDRKRLGEIVFADPDTLIRLNRIVHPRMREMMREEIDCLKVEGVDVVVLEAAVLIEASWTDLVDEVWVAVAPEQVVVKRLEERGGLSEEQARARIRSQISTEERAKHADIIIDTDCELSEVRARIEELWETLKNREGYH